MHRVRKRRLQRRKYYRFKNQTSPSKSCYSSLRHHHPQMAASATCWRFPLLEAMGRAEHVSALKHNSLEPEISVHNQQPQVWAKGEVLHRAGGSPDLSALLPILLWNRALTDRAGQTVEPHFWLSGPRFLHPHFAPQHFTQAVLEAAMLMLP